MAIPNDMTRIASGLSKVDGSNSGDYDGSVPKAARQLIRRAFKLYKPAADSMATDTTAYTAADQTYMPAAGRILGAWIQPQSTLTAHDTNYATVNVVSADNAAGSAVVMASQTTKITGGSGNWAAGVKEALTVTSTEADRHFDKGDVLSFSIAKASSGVAVPICSITVYVELEGTDDFAV